MEITSIKPNSVPVPEVPNVSPQESAQRQQVIHAIKAINSSEMLGQDDELVFVFDRANHRAIVRLVNRGTREVVMQVPAEYVLRLAEDLKQKS